MNYKLNKLEKGQQKTSVFSALGKFWPLVTDEKKIAIGALIAVLFNSAFNLVSPLLVGYSIDHYIKSGDLHGLMVMAGILLVIYLLAFGTHYIQVHLMGGLGQRVLFKLRNQIFKKLQSFPVAFFNQNKAGDLISRINNDTDNLNQFFSQSLMQFIGTLFIMTGAAIFLVAINPLLGLASLVPAILIAIFTALVSPWVKRKNAASLQSTGGMSAEIQESLSNFKVIVAFNRRNYFRDKFDEANQNNFLAAVKADLANNIFNPVYGLSAHLAQLIVFSVGVYMISAGSLTVGFLISFLMYIGKFYDPVRQLAAVWSTFQVAMAAWERIYQILSMKSDFETIEGHQRTSESLLEFKDVSFHYPDGREVLKQINFTLERGKTYALVGPTGGGKTTTASLMARLYDPTEGQVVLQGKDIRSYDAINRTKKIGFILQEPFLFTGTVRDNILYGNEDLETLTNEQLMLELEKANLGHLMKRFEQGLETPVESAGESISFGQRQLIAFMRAILRKPELLILDEATANIDTFTEQLLEDVLMKLHHTTTRVIIAHRLNTIQDADEIFFVNSGEVTRAGSLDHAMEMLLKGKKNS
ncbi:ABC transporter ATP-binding protein [Candidatus Peregrinibacteria bacterium]|nr:ABC transporter ATP-binding protein [Candidatus Peregrinibacteria bacterium]